MARTAKQVLALNNYPLWRAGIDSLALAGLDTDIECDVAIIGGGFSGLWSAFHLLRFDSNLRIAIFEAEEIGFGASGRNGGWVSADYPVDRATLSRRYPYKDVTGFVELLARGVNEIGEIARKIAPRAHFRKAGSLSFATNGLQLSRLRDSIDDRHHLLSQDETQSRVNIPSAMGGLFTEDCATVNPRGLLFDLANYLQKEGVKIFERSIATDYEDGLWVNGFRVRSPWKVVATEAFTPKSRKQIPLYSLMIATRVLTEAERNLVGWTSGLAIAEGTNNVNYAQLAEDSRIALGGRGARYPFASRLDSRLEFNSDTHRNLSSMLHRWFPQLSASEVDREIEVTHHWGGPIAIRRNWESFICVDQSKGLARLGGYVGDGLTMSFVAARAVAEEIVTGARPWLEMPVSTDCARPKKWPIEPFRYLGANSLIAGIAKLDASEEAGRESRWSGVLQKLIGN